jgi:ABC-2 type transport system ATP-binding protein
MRFSVPAGKITAFVGPNGAGKTTTIRLLLGLTRPTSGVATVLGSSIVHPPAYLPRVGALIEAPAFYPTLSGRRNLDVLARLGGLPQERIDDMLELVGLVDRAGHRVSTYSLGMKQRLGIAAALLPGPELLVLDEPTNGLDPAGIVEIRALLRRLADAGATVFTSSHLLAEVQQSADWLVVIKSGRVLFEGSVSDMLGEDQAVLVARPEHATDIAKLTRIARSAGYTTRRNGSRLHVHSTARYAAELNRTAAKQGVTLVELHMTQPTLESTFIELTADDESPR